MLKWEFKPIPHAPRDQAGKILILIRMRIGRREFLISAGRAGAGAAALSLAGPLLGRVPAERKPNIILIVADDLGYSQLGCYGEKRIKTPSLDRLAAGGVRFTDAYSGSPVCAPSRCVLMTGMHSGHAQIRDNMEIQPEGQGPLAEGTPNLPALLKAEGYATAAVGKWVLGFPGSTGDPGKQGIDFFYGYNCQRHAHNHYPTYLWRNKERIEIEGTDRNCRRIFLRLFGRVPWAGP